MNKKILLSVAAAATISTLLTGCGSSSDSSASTTSGNAVKANLNGANVSMGGTSVKTDENGSFTVTGTGSLISIQDGNYTVDGGVKVNKMIIKAAKSLVDSGVEASILTTLMDDFKDSTNPTASAFALLGIPYVEGVDLTTKKAASFEAAALSVAMTIEATNGDATALTALMTALKTTADANADANTTVDATGLNNALSTAAIAAGVDSVRLSAMLNSIEAGNSFQHILDLEELDSNETVDYDASKYSLNNTLDLTSDDFNGTHASFSLMDNNITSEFANANGNTSLFINIQGLEAANLNSSYAMALTGLNIAKSGDYVTIASGTAPKLSTLVGTTLNKKITEDTNASDLCELSFLTSDANTTRVNVAAFRSFMETTYPERDVTGETAKYGSVKLASGNYSVSVSVNVNGETISYNEKIKTIVPSSMETKDYNGAVVFEDMTGYQVIDSSLIK